MNEGDKMPRQARIRSELGIYHVMQNNCVKRTVPVTPDIVETRGIIGDGADHRADLTGGLDLCAAMEPARSAWSSFSTTR